MSDDDTSCITLKWGTLKGWRFSKDNEEAMKLIRRYHEFGVSISAALQKDTAEQKEILCDVIRLPGMKVYLDWDGKYVTQAEGVNYILNYG